MREYTKKARRELRRLAGIAYDRDREKALGELETNFRKCPVRSRGAVAVFNERQTDGCPSTASHCTTRSEPTIRGLCPVPCRP